jgi:rhodanese-related sulfurtransferase
VTFIDDLLEATVSSHVTAVSAASAQSTIAHIEAKLAFETDCWDVHDAMANDQQDFVLLDVRSPNSYAKGHVPGAINLLRGKMTARKMAEWPEGTIFVTYCAGPHCNGADKAALVLAKLGLPVKIMIGGATGWADEGFDFSTGALAA